MRVCTTGKYALPPHVGAMWYHYFMQYKVWEAEYNSLGGIRGRILDNAPGRGSGTGDPTAAAAIRRAELSEKMEGVRKVARLSDPELFPWIMKGLTDENMTFTALQMRHDIPCSSNTYFDRLRRCYWLADQIQSWGFVYKDFKRGKLVFLDRDGNEIP